MPALRLEVFDTASPGDGTLQPLVEVTAVEEAKVAGFEQGYTAGWDDAVAAQQGDQARLRADLARNLQSLAFTFQDARSHVLQSIRPLMLEMINRLLPEVARAALAPTVLEALSPIAADLADTPLTLVLNPAVRSQVEDLVAEATGLPMVIEEEPSLPEGQVYIRFGTSETKVDLSQVTAEIAAAVRAFFTLNT
ncbi:flagellar biosynthesis protein [Rhodobacter calidifons]|uniref:Flagellar biosynthesis protein n=1 Tax=Rhodobacter calidifons TaxID=2715277 RepID=A0ABX0G5V8_9RHOB|nr:flagellar biosynthesis protein [Rhodobacter calidifons]NHB76640.1 flagellar biosynthesis protein [Rhodobacter calidifons]